jgi:hypothetical protein
MGSPEITCRASLREAAAEVGLSGDDVVAIGDVQPGGRPRQEGRRRVKAVGHDGPQAERRAERNEQRQRVRRPVGTRKPRPAYGPFLGDPSLPGAGTFDTSSRGRTQRQAGGRRSLAPLVGCSRICLTSGAIVAQYDSRMRFK